MLIGAACYLHAAIATNATKISALFMRVVIKVRTIIKTGCYPVRIVFGVEIIQPAVSTIRQEGEPWQNFLMRLIMKTEKPDYRKRFDAMPSNVYVCKAPDFETAQTCCGFIDDSDAVSVGCKYLFGIFCVREEAENGKV